ncbi:MAG: sugar phosphate isomerase/epimerase [Candidatus Dormibacteraeota bacterium]|nr:sugar phosphate isomerase/epimerase [Candidatus Dormibacteraeota bacterium]
MNPIGANTWIWVSPLTGERLASLAPRVRGFGFDVIELPIEDPGDWDPGHARELLDEHGLMATTCAVMSPERDLTSPDRDVIQSTQQYVRSATDMAARVGARSLAGPIYSPVGKTWAMDSTERAAVIGRLVENLKPLADYAGERGVTLALEPLNRFETSLINTAEQVMEVVDRVGSPALGVLLDTFHMNIEERDPGAAIRACGRHIAHFHACGCDRGAPGGDQVPWPKIAAALRGAGYEGPIVIESFTIENQAIARAAAIWRPLAPTQDAIATEGLRFLRALLS